MQLLDYAAQLGIKAYWQSGYFPAVGNITGSLVFKKYENILELTKFDDQSVMIQRYGKPTYWVRETTPNFVRTALIYGLILGLNEIPDTPASPINYLTSPAYEIGNFQKKNANS